MAPTFAKRLQIALAGYGVVIVFGVVFWALHGLKELSSAERLILSAAVAAPLALALLWEHLKGLKIGEIEITLKEVTPPINIELAGAIQDLQGSGTPALVEGVSAAVKSKEMRLVEINLRDSSYWWSTRLYLLAALAEEYTSIKRLVFVEQNAARLYLGMASPSAVRKMLARRFPGVQRAFRELQQGVGQQGEDASTQVMNIGYQWSGQLFRLKDQDPSKLVTEGEFREIISSSKLSAWLGNDLETEFREWNGETTRPELYAKILSCSVPYVPLLTARRLDKVVDRNDLAIRIASSGI